jgi:hypothetical protein
MRLTTSTAATLATAGLAALVTGCSSSSPSASGPVATHHATKAAPAAAVAPAAPLNPKAALAKAVRDSLAMHTVQFRYRDTRTLVKPSRGENVNPYFIGSGIANFDSNLLTLHAIAGAHAEQPLPPAATGVVDGDSKYFGGSGDAVSGVPWTKASASSGDAADVQITQVLQDVKGPVTVVHKTANVTEYQLQSNMSQLVLDQSDTADKALAAQLAGTTQTENVWVNRDGLIVRARWTIDPGKAHVAGLDPSVVKAVYITVDFANYGVDMVVPPHPTSFS